MAVSVTCDTCGAPVRAVGFKVVWAGSGLTEHGDMRDVCGDYCSAVCIQRALAKSGVRRPAFREAHEVLERLDAEHDLDERAMSGEYDNPVDIEAGLPYSPPTQVFSGARRNHALASADVVAVLGATR